MSRQRFIYPAMWTSEQVMMLTRDARLLWCGIISTADDYGRRKATAASLKIELLPLDIVTVEQVTEWRDEIARAGMIRLYLDDEGVTLLDIPTWEKYQKPKYVSKSRHPEYPGAGPVNPGKAANLGQPRPTLDETEPSLPPIRSSGVVWCGVERSGVKSPAVDPGMTRDVLCRGHAITDETAGIVHRWKSNGEKPFNEWGKLWARVMDFDKIDPITLLAHCIEIMHSSRIKNRPATLYKRLEAPKDGQKRRLPADRYMGMAKDIISGANADRPRSEAVKLVDILNGGK